MLVCLAWRRAVRGNLAHFPLEKGLWRRQESHSSQAFCERARDNSCKLQWGNWPQRTNACSQEQLNTGMSTQTGWGTSITRGFQTSWSLAWSSFKVGLVLHSGLDLITPKWPFNLIIFCNSMIPIVYVSRRNLISEEPPVTFILTGLQAVPPVRSQTLLLCFFSQKLHILFPSR